MTARYIMKEYSLSPHEKASYLLINDRGRAIGSIQSKPKYALRLGLESISPLTYYRMIMNPTKES